MSGRTGFGSGQSAHAPRVGIGRRLLGPLHFTGVFWYPLHLWGARHLPEIIKRILVPAIALTFFLFLGLLVIGNPVSAFRKLTFDQSFLLLLLAVIFFRFLLLPDLADRFYFGFYLIIIMLLVRKFSAQISTTSHEDR